jgi:hypothetical protein
MKRSFGLLVVGVLLAGCSGGGTPAPTGSGGGLSVPALKLRVLDALPGPLDYCDPDVYPVAHGTPLQNALAHAAQMRRDRVVYGAILFHEGLTPVQGLSNVELLRTYQLYKETRVISLTLAASGNRYFSILVHGSPSDQLVSGTVDAAGHVVIASRKSATRPSCPICLARGTPIATPAGPVPVDRVRAGMAVWSIDRNGERIRAIVLRTRQRAADGELLEIRLANGRSVLVSPRHPLPHGGVVGQLVVGDRLGGSRVAGITTIAYRGFTYDLLPSGPTGDYFAGGILLGSTLAS